MGHVTDAGPIHSRLTLVPLLVPTVRKNTKPQRCGVIKRSN